MFMLLQSDKSSGNLKTVSGTVKLRVVFGRAEYRANKSNCRIILNNLHDRHNTDKTYIKFQRHFQTQTQIFV
jgi:hypothetical protein